MGQAANLQLLLLRDGYLHGAEWGYTDHDRALILIDLQDAIAAGAAWALRIFGWGISGALSTGGVDYRGGQPFRSTNAFPQQMVPAVLDVAQRWPLFDTVAHPGPGSPDEVYLTSEIYSDLYGTADDSGLVILPWQAPTRLPSQITLWSGSLVDAVQLTYPDGGGPDGVITTARAGGSGGTPATVPIRAGNPITTVDVWAGDVVGGIRFTFEDGSAQAGRVLSSIHVNGTSNYYGTADSVVFGFKYEPPAPSREDDDSARGRRCGKSSASRR